MTLETCVPTNLLQVVLICSLLHPLHGAQSVSVPMATLPWESKRKEKMCCSLFVIALPFLQPGWRLWFFFHSLSLSHFSVNWLLTAGGYYWLQKLHFLAPELLIFSWIIAVSGGQIQVPESLGCFGFDLESFFCSPHHMKQSFDHCRHMLKKKIQRAEII